MVESKDKYIVRHGAVSFAEDVFSTGEEDTIFLDHVDNISDKFNSIKEAVNAAVKALGFDIKLDNVCYNYDPDLPGRIFVTWYALDRAGQKVVNTDDHDSEVYKDWEAGKINLYAIIVDVMIAVISEPSIEAIKKEIPESI